MTPSPATHQDNVTAVERFLRLFTEVRPGEGRTAIIMFLNVFLILCSYYFIKPLREGWIAVSDIQSLSKMEVKAYSSFGQSLLLVAVVSYYGRLADRWDRSKLITWATLFCMSNMVVFWFLQPDFFIRNLPFTGIAFYLWVGMFGVFVVAQFWAFAADLYSDEQGRRLIPMVAIGATAGAASGSWITNMLVGSGIIGAEFLLLAALVPLTVSIYLTGVADRRGPVGSDEGDGKRDESSSHEPVQRPAAAKTQRALDIVLRNRFLFAVALMTLIMSWVNTNGENLLFRVIQEFLAHDAETQGVTGDAALLKFTRDGTTVFYGNFYLWVNIVALFLQAFVASRLLKYGGFAAILLLMPVVALVSYTVMALVPILGVVKFWKIAENSTDYSINNTARHVLWLPVTPEMKYKGKPTIDTLFVRAGDGLAAVTVLIGVQFLSLSTAAFFAFTVALVLVWLALSRVVIREHRRLTADA
jgi:AAA family ATP:ADP antiporter